MQVVLRKLRSQPFPLYIAVLMKDAATWRSADNVNDADLPDTAEAAFNALLDSLELHLGTVFVSHTLAYITVSHNGLSEVCFQEATLFICTIGLSVRYTASPKCRRQMLIIAKSA